MKLEILLKTIDKHIEEIKKNFSKEEQNKFVDLLNRISAEENDISSKNAGENLIDFCQEHLYLKKILEKAADVQPIVFRGKPQPKPMTEEAKQIRLLANRLIDAIEKPINIKSKKKSEQ